MSRKTFPKFSGLGWRILLWMAVVAFVPLFVMAYQGYHCASGAIVAAQNDHLQSVIDSRKARLEAWLQGVESDVRLLSISYCTMHDCGMMSDDQHESCNFLELKQKQNSHYESVLAFDRNWLPLEKGMQPGLKRISVPEELRSKLSDSADSAATLNVMDGRLLLHVGKQIHSVDADAAYVVATVDMSAAIEPILSDRTGLGMTGKVYLVSEEGDYLKSQSSEGKEHSPKSILSTGSDVLEYHNSYGRKVFGTSEVIDDLGMMVVVEIEVAEALAGLSSLRRRAIATGSLTLIIVILAAVAISRKLAHPLHELARVANGITAGRDERVHQLDLPEADAVGSAFNQMLDELAVSQRRLLQAASLAARLTAPILLQKLSVIM